jgi:hypothetical protein
MQVNALEVCRIVESLESPASYPPQQSTHSIYTLTAITHGSLPQPDPHPCLPLSDVLLFIPVRCSHTATIPIHFLPPPPCPSKHVPNLQRAYLWPNWLRLYRTGRARRISRRLQCPVPECDRPDGYRSQRPGVGGDRNQQNPPADHGVCYFYIPTPDIGAK